MDSRPPNKRTGANDTLLFYEQTRRKKCSCCAICCIICCTTIIILVFLALILLFVGVPLVFKHSPELQRSIVFPTSKLLPSNPEFNNFAKYDIQGARNIELTLDYAIPIQLGVWHLLPHALVNKSLAAPNFDYALALRQNRYPVIIHFHSNGGNRIRYRNMYKVLRNYFHVIAFDYRGYADSTNATVTEEGIVQDSVKLYNWVRKQTDADIYFWGHDIGAALSTHTIARLHEDDDYVVPMGLFLEAPFTSMSDQINEVAFFRKLFSWLPWYESTILNPLGKNGFSLNTAAYIQDVECPIMIIHAEDDEVSPPKFSKELANIAEAYLDAQVNGNVTLHLIPASFGYGHFLIYRWADLSSLIKRHIEICEEYRYI